MTPMELLSWILLAGLVPVAVVRVLIRCDVENAPDPHSVPQPQPKKGV